MSKESPGMFVLIGKKLSHLCCIYPMTDRPSVHSTVICYHSLSFKSSTESRIVRLWEAISIFTFLPLISGNDMLAEKMQRNYINWSCLIPLLIILFISIFQAVEL